MRDAIQDRPSDQSSGGLGGGAGIQEGEGLYRATFEQAAVGMAHVGSDGRFLRVNPRLCEILGYSEEELMRLTFHDLSQPEEGDQESESWSGVSAGNRNPRRTERRYRRKNGETLWADLVTTPAREEAGKLQYFISVLEDITLRKIAEFRLQRLNRLYAVLSGVSEAIVRVGDPQQLFEIVCRIAVEDGFLRTAIVVMADASSGSLVAVASCGGSYPEGLESMMNGGSLNEGTTRTAIRTGHYEVCNDIANDPRQCREEAAASSFRAVASFPLRSNGDAIGAIILCAGEVNYFQEDEIRLMVAVSADVSYALDGMRKETLRLASEELLRASEERYRQSEERLQSIFDGSREGMLIESEGLIVYVNQSCLQLLGYDRPEDLIGRDVSSFTSPEVSERLSDYGRRPLRGEAVPTIYDVSLRRKDGVSVQVEAAVSVSTVNRKQYTTTSVRDITERKRVEDALRKSENEQRELAISLEEERARLAEAQSLAKVGSWELDHRTNVLWWSDEIYNVFGVEPDEFGASYEFFLECVHPDDRARVDMVFTDSVANRRPYSIDHRLLMKDGSVKIVNESSQTVYADDGRAIRSTGTTQDITERKLAELALSESAEEFRTLSEAMPQIVWMALPDGRSIYSNKRWVEFTGMSLEESHGHGWNRAFHPEDQERAGRIWEASTKTGGIFELEGRMRRADGAYHWMLIRALPLRDPSGNITKWLGTCTDIDEMKLAMEAIRASEDRFKLFANVTNDAIWDWNLVTRETWRSEGFGALFGYSDDVTGNIDWWATRIAPEDRERVVKHLEDVIKGRGSQWSDEYSFLCSDETRAYILDRGYVMRNDAGEPVRMIGGMTDLSERHAVEEKLAQQAALIDDARDAMMVQDLDHRITFWSKGAERLYGWQSGEVMGLRFDELLHIGPAEFEASMKPLLATGAWTGEVTKTTASGDVLTVDSRCTLLRDPRGQPQSIFAVDTDITERKKLEQQFLRSQRMESVGTLAGGIAHDLNNLLMPIMMGVSLLKRFEPAEKSLKVIQNIELSARRAAELVRQVLSFARGVEGSRVAVHLGDIVREVASIIENTFPKDIAFEAKVSPGLWLVAGDPTQLSQVLLNLCLNARDAMPHGGKLDVCARNVEIIERDAAVHPGMATGKYVVLTVTDNGSGMTKEIADRIFEPFFTTKDLGQGTGLGLSTTIGIVRSHDAIVNVATEPGKGTTFNVYFPPRLEMTSAGDTEAGVVEGPPRGNGELILVVDDEAAVLNITKQTLETFGYKVLTAANGEEALACYRSQRKKIAMVLTDMMMPRMNGPALIAQIRLIDRDAVIVAVTGLDNRVKLSGSETSFTRFLLKPYTAELLLETVFAAIGKKRRDNDSE